MFSSVLVLVNIPRPPTPPRPSFPRQRVRLDFQTTSVGFLLFHLRLGDYAEMITTEEDFYWKASLLLRMKCLSVDYWTIKYTLIRILNEKYDVCNKMKKKILKKRSRGRAAWRLLDEWVLIPVWPPRLGGQPAECHWFPPGFMAVQLSPMWLLVSSAEDTSAALKRYIISHTHVRTPLRRTHLLAVRAIAAPSISYYLFLWPSIDQGCSCAAYDVLYYLGISVIAGCWRWVGGGIRVCHGSCAINLQPGDVKCLHHRGTTHGATGCLVVSYLCGGGSDQCWTKKQEKQVGRFFFYW